MTTKKDMQQYIAKERNSMRTIAGQLGDIYIKFKMECVKRKINFREGIEIAIRDLMKKWNS